MTRTRTHPPKAIVLCSLAIRVKLDFIKFIGRSKANLVESSRESPSYTLTPLPISQKFLWNKKNLSNDFTYCFVASLRDEDV
jgi:hypothetical protein